MLKVQQLIVYAMMGCCLFVLIMAIYFKIQKQYYNSLMALLIFGFCTYITILTNQPLISISIYQDKILSYMQRKNIEQTVEQSWNRLYQHPLIVRFSINDPNELQQRMSLTHSLKIQPPR